VWQLSDESYGIRQQDRVAIADIHFTREGIQGGKKTILDKHLNVLRHLAQDGGFSGVRVAYQRHTIMRFPSFTLDFSRPLHVRKSLLEHTDTMLDEPTVRFKLGLTRTAYTNATAKFLEVRPHARETGQQVLQLCEFHLHTRLTRPGARGKDIKDQFGTVHDPGSNNGLDVLSLCRRQFIVENHQGGAKLGDAHFQLINLPAAEVGRRMGTIESLRQATHHDGTGRIRQTGQLFEVLVGLMTGVATF